MGGLRDCYTEWSKSDKDKHHIKYHVFPLCGIQKMVHMKLFTKQKQSHRFRKQFFGYQEYEGEG